MQEPIIANETQVNAQINAQNHAPVNARAIAKYALLPGVLPRLGRLARHFSEFMFIFTQLFGSIGLIDPHHPCLRQENIGLYRFRDIVMLAAGNIRWNKQNIPQIFMFFAIMLSILLMVAVCVLFVVNALLTVGVAQAQFFGTPQGSGYSSDTDWAFQFLSRIFGMEDFFAPSQGGNLWFTALLTGMLKHYSMAMLVIAAFMIMYLMLMTLTEAARTGKPFGTRFDSIWAPIRMALAIGLLIPITSAGYNGAQLMVFQSAKWGSNLATNAWYAGLTQASDAKYFGAAMADQGYRFIRDITLVNLCVQILNEQRTKEHYDSQGGGFVKYSTTVDDEFITISFGPKSAPDFCGEVKILKMPPQTLPGLTGTAWPQHTAVQFQNIAKEFIPAPLNMVSMSGQSATPPQNQVMKDFVTQMAKKVVNDKDKSFSEHVLDVAGQSGSDEIMGWVEKYWSQLGRQSSDVPFFSSGETKTKLNEYSLWMKEQLLADAKYGWTTAGVFYLRMSAVMSGISTVTNNPPRVSILPSNLVKMFAEPENARADTDKMQKKCENSWNKWLFLAKTCKKLEFAVLTNSALLGATDWFLNTVKDDPVVYRQLGTESYDRALELRDGETPVNPNVSTVMRPIFSALMSVVQISENDLHPLGTVITWGFNLMAVSIVAMTIGMVALGGFGEIAMMVGTTLFIPAVLLAFWVPMLPFMYFTFAVIEWMVSVLEAVIGMPLWALSLISLEGEGLGKGMNGVKMVFEIILRPTIIIVSLVASIVLFTAGIGFFNSAISLYQNAYDTGFGGSNSGFSNAASALGMVFVYMFVVYSLATSSFKLIDAIPDNFGRWGGLPKGFGGGIRMGLSQTQQILMGAAVVGGITGMAKQARGHSKGVKAKRDNEMEQAGTNNRLYNLERKTGIRKD